MKKLFHGVYIASFQDICMVKPYFSCNSPGKGGWKIEIVLDCGVSAFSDKGYSCRADCAEAVDKTIDAINAEVAKELAVENKS